MRIPTLLIITFILFSTTYGQTNEAKDIVIAKGHMPNISKDKSNHLHVVYGSGDSIMYLFSKDGKTYTAPATIAVLPGLFAASMRGPQIAATGNGIVVTACTRSGNIFSYTKDASGKWTKAEKVNDVDETAKEALISLSADGLNAYVVWLSVKKPKGQNLYGAKTSDGGKTWSKNILVYESPDGSVCECCKPSVVVRGNTVHVMFRNWLNGSRDLYLIKSINGGRSFEQAQKLGEGTWKLNGCPMDGGGIALDKNESPETVWRREGKIYASAPGKPEREIGEGRGCTIETINNKTIYAWAQNGDIIVMNNDGTKKSLGKGSLPLVKAVNNTHAVCIWENDQQIHAKVFQL
jgi:hypothetical protein